MSAISPKKSPGPRVRLPWAASTSALPSRITKKSPPLFPFSVRTFPAGRSTSSAREAMNASSLSEQLPKSGTDRRRSTRASATARSLASLGDPPPGRVDLGDQRRPYAVRQLALVVGVEHDDVRTSPRHERAHPAAAAEGVGGVERRRDDRFVRRQPAERDAERDRGGHPFERRGSGVVIRREGDGNARRDESARVRR